MDTPKGGTYHSFLQIHSIIEIHNKKEVVFQIIVHFEIQFCPTVMLIYALFLPFIHEKIL
jgi:hypothetical protein